MTSPRCWVSLSQATSHTQKHLQLGLTIKATASPPPPYLQEEEGFPCLRPGRVSSPPAPLAPAPLDSVPLPLVSPLESQSTVVLNDTALFFFSFNLIQNGHTAYFPVHFFSPQHYETRLLILSGHMVSLSPRYLLHEYTTHPPLRTNGDMGFFRLQAITKCCCFTLLLIPWGPRDSLSSKVLPDVAHSGMDDIHVAHGR